MTFTRTLSTCIRLAEEYEARRPEPRPDGLDFHETARSLPERLQERDRIRQPFVDFLETLDDETILTLRKLAYFAIGVEFEGNGTTKAENVQRLLEQPLAQYLREGWRRILIALRRPKR